ncbi:MAG: hypothetical protein JWN70_4015 [Planctomycetaceae bacterium]|nr:hypothetical protein [Planctomycetaceae bacterium]
MGSSDDRFPNYRLFHRVDRDVENFRFGLKLLFCDEEKTRLTDKQLAALTIRLTPTGVIIEHPDANLAVRIRRFIVAQGWHKHDPQRW